MKFSSKEDIEVPIADVFEMLSDFGAFEQMIQRRGVSLDRLYGDAPPVTGMIWHAAFQMRGLHREADVELAEYTAPTRLQFLGKGQGLEGSFEIDLIRLAATRTRIAVALDMKPRTLAARLFLQSLKLAKGSLTKRFKQRVADFARQIESRHANRD